MIVMKQQFSYFIHKNKKNQSRLFNNNKVMGKIKELETNKNNS